MAHHQINEPKRVIGDHLKHSELVFLNNVQGIFRNVLSSNHGFEAAVNSLTKSLKQVDQKNFNVSTRLNVDMHNFNETLSKAHSGSSRGFAKLTKHEQQFAKDVVAVIDFVMRNGIGFSLIVDVLSHDLREIVKHKNLGLAIKDGFWPKASGWASYDPEQIYASEEVGA